MEKFETPKVKKYFKLSRAIKKKNKERLMTQQELKVCSKSNPIRTIFRRLTTRSGTEKTLAETLSITSPLPEED